MLAFGKDVVVAKSQDADKDGDRVVGDLLALRGFGTTDVAGALQTAAAQLGRSRAARKITVLLSDCRATVDGDPLAAARGLDELVVIAPEERQRGGGSVRRRCRRRASPPSPARPSPRCDRPPVVLSVLTVSPSTSRCMPR